jgi:DNA-binding NtrC family response regulator
MLSANELSMFQGRFQRAPANEFETTSSRRASVFRHSFGEKYMNDRPQILVVSPDLDHRRALTSILQKDGWSPLHASRLHECHDLLARQNVGLVFCERRLTDGTYRDLISVAQTPARRVPIVVTSRLADWDEYLEALSHGAVDLIPSPCKPSDVFSAIAQAQREDQELSVSTPSQSESEHRAISVPGA